MKFRNKVNGHVIEKNMPGLWVVLFGGFYFLFSGIWMHFLILLVLSMVLIGSTGGGGFVMMLVVNLVYAAFASSVVRSHYLSNGWEEVVPGADHGVRKCPMCAEEIRAEAVKCKHCGSDVDPLPPSEVKEDVPRPVPQNFTLG